MTPEKSPNTREVLKWFRSQQAVVPAFDEHLLFNLERRYFDFLNTEELSLSHSPAFDLYDFREHLRLIRIDEVTHLGAAEAGLHLLNMQNVLASMADPHHAAVSVVVGDGHKTSLYYGLSRTVGRDTADAPGQPTGTEEYKRILAQTMHGNFLGAKFTPLNASQTFHEVLRPMQDAGEVLALPGIPSLRLKDASGPFSQGIDRFVEGMRGEEYALVIIAEPVTMPQVDGMIGNLWDLATAIHPTVKAIVAKTRGSSDTLNIGMFGMMGDSTGRSSTDAWGSGETMLGSGGALSAVTTGLGTAAGSGVGALLGTFLIPIPGIGTAIGASIGAGLGTALGSSVGAVTTWASGLPLAQNSNFTRAVTNSQSQSTGQGGFGGYARSWSRSVSVTQEMLNKRAEYAEQVCNQYIKRLQGGKNLGFWNVGVYLLAKNRYTRLRGRGLLRAVMSGDETHFEPVRTITLNRDTLGDILCFNNPQFDLLRYGIEPDTLREAVTAGDRIRAYCQQAKKSVETFFREFLRKSDAKNADELEAIRRQPASATEEQMEEAWRTIREAQLGHPLGPLMGGVATPMNTEELAILINVPRQEVQGITIREAEPFGVNYPPSGNPDGQVHIGNIIHKREVLKDAPFTIDRKAMMKHGFICGVTGAGKTNTLMHMLSGCGVPFLVIEPAKSEYRQMLDAVPGLRVFTLGEERISPFRLNPFDFPQGIGVLSHIDQLKSVFNAAFPMYASMPYLLEEAIVEVYRDKGWELATSTNRYCDVNAKDDIAYYMPTLEDLLAKVEEVVSRMKYAQQLTLDLSAALKARLSSLLTGSKGLMLNTRRSTPIEDLLCGNTILELKHIGDDDEKAFLMGLLLTRLYEYREATGGPTGDLRHVTVIEEAHRLLRRVPEVQSLEVANARGKAVETFANILSEIRVYGECMLIVDQIPSKLTPDVTKNTGLKIVHRLLAKDDRDSVGDTMTLTEGQKRELPLLRVGQVVVHREDLDKPFLVQVPARKGSPENRVTNDSVLRHMRPYHRKNDSIFDWLPGMELHKDLPEVYARSDFRDPDSRLVQAVLSMLLAVYTGDHAAMNAVFRRVSNFILQRSQCRGDAELLAQVIFYANRAFRNVNAVKRNRYGTVLNAHRMFMTCIGHLVRKRPQDLPLEALQAALGELAAPGDTTDLLVKLWVDSDPQSARRLVVQLDKMIKPGALEENRKRVSEICRDQILFGVSLTEEHARRIEKGLMSRLFVNHPRRGQVLAVYGRDAGLNRQ